MNALSEFASDDRGLETVEYAIMAGLVVTASVAVIIALGAWVKETYSNLQQSMK